MHISHLLKAITIAFQSPLPPGYICFDPSKLNITIVDSGGTISGAGDTPTSALYRSGVLGIRSVAESAGVCKFANIRIVPFYHGDSINLDFQVMLHGSRIIQESADDPTVYAVILSGGTDGQDVFATTVDQTVSTSKAIVFISALRPATNPSTDGTGGLLDAVCLGIYPGARNRGVLVLGSGRIFAARLAFKINANQLDAFRAHPGGLLGQMINHRPIFGLPPSRLSRHDIFNIKTIPERFQVPRIETVYAQIGIETLLPPGDLDAIIMVGFGGGYWPESDSILKRARDLGIPIIIVSRVPYAFVDAPPPCGFGIGGGFRNPQQAFVVVALCKIKQQGETCMREALADSEADNATLVHEVNGYSQS
ncbi:Asparaginase/glutaminase [Thelonectria olida]|uniref:asparaginase n=1 Tax=Thelonectria olida TaxID=1576542 RepID=A0A9P9AMA6_9HYPO|nr:Asparaginase/glutaminase [Thelonectria olida]